MVQINFAKREITLQFAWLSRAGDGALAWVFPEQRAALGASLQELALLEDRLRGAGLDPTTLPSLLQWPPGAPAGLVRWHERLQLKANHPADLLRGLQLVSGAVIGRLEHAYCDCMFATDRRWVWGDAVLHTNLDAGVTHCVSPRDSRPTPIL